jgi:hypothetical protein
MTIPPNLDRDGLEHYRLHVEQMLNRMTQEAEAWAEAGTPKVEQVPIRRAPMRLRHRPVSGAASAAGELQQSISAH